MKNMILGIQKLIMLPINFVYLLKILQKLTSIWNINLWHRKEITTNIL